MKKIIIILLSLCLIVSSIPALAAAGDATIFSTSMVNDSYSLYGCVYAKDTLYLFTYNNTYFAWTREGGLKQYEFNSNEFSEQEDGEPTGNIMGYMTDGEKVYVRMSYNLYTSGDEDSSGTFEFDHTEIREMIFAEDGTYTFGEPIVLDYDDDMFNYYDDNSYERETRKPFIDGDYLVFSTYTDNGGGVCSFDLTTGEGELIEVEDNIDTICKYKDNKALFFANHYEEGKGATYAFWFFDYVTGEITKACDFPTADDTYSLPNQLVYDETEDTLYYVYAGELYKAIGLDFANAQTLNSIPLDSWGDYQAALTDDKYFICADYSSVIIRNTDPTQRASTKITVSTGYNDSLKNAYYEYSTKNPDIEVVLNDNLYDNNITQTMMNQSGDIDIYNISLNSADFEALYNRGYMAELNDSKILTDFMNSVYPSIRDACVKDGQLLAIPLDFYCDTITVNKVLLEEIGITEDKLPKTWKEFFEFINSMKDILGEDSKYNLFEGWNTQEDMKNSFFYILMRNYAYYLKYDDSLGMSFDTDVLRETLEAYEKLDLSWTGLAETYEDFNDNYDFNYDTLLVRTYGDVSCNSYNSYNGFSPLILKFTDEEEPLIFANYTLAFVNPYSANREAAIKYLEETINSYSNTFVRNICPNENEPIPSTYYDEAVQYYNDAIASTQAELDKATDEDEIANWQQQLDEVNKNYEEFKEYGQWSVSAESIAVYRVYAESIRPERDLGLSTDANSEYYDLQSQYIDGQSDINELLKGLDKKIQMMIKEGL